ncbi:MAG: UvrD-helicase domain-containing protein [Candidatus Borkfalkiaceae bacterium]|nr:UvrD-helicase domain-containing protein [Christensenellaceae bacterium]
MQEYLAKLNQDQIGPVMETEGAVLVIAGAGSGKTRVLTSRITHLVLDKGVDPYNVLAITFTNKAAGEMKERIASMVGEQVNDMWVCTIHSMCVKILRSCATLIGYDQNFSIYSETDKEKVLKRILAGLSLDAEEYLRTAKNYISERKNKDLEIAEFAEGKKYQRKIADYVKIMEAYEEELKKSNAFDFDDLLIRTYHLLAEFPQALKKYAERFRYVHIDEFQDTNVVQYKIVRLLSSVHGNVFAVGDDDQSIYGWRGADINNILGFEKDFRNAKVFKLERNYRSTKKILELANAVISNNENRKSKVLWTENEDGVKPELYCADEESGEAQYTAIQIKTLLSRGYKYSDFAVLMRLNALSRSYEQEFLKYGIPCKVYGGFKFFERKEIKDLTAYLRILCNPLDNEAVLRVINVPKRGIGAKSVDVLTDYAVRNGFSVFDSVYDVERLPLSEGAKNKISVFRNLLAGLIVAKENLSLPDLVKRVVDDTEFMNCFLDDTSENEEKKRNVDEFLNSVEEFYKANPDAPLSEYLNSITLSSDTDEINEGEYVTLATVHSVKGLEYPCVFICGLDREIFPVSRAYDNPADLEEERRLMYVAITRAEKRLYFTRAKSRFLYGSRRQTVQSEFLDEIAPVLGTARGRNYYSPHDDSYRFGEHQTEYPDFGEYGRSSRKTNAYKEYSHEDSHDGYVSRGKERTPSSFGSFGYHTQGDGDRVYGSQGKGDVRSSSGSFASSYRNAWSGTASFSGTTSKAPSGVDPGKIRSGVRVVHRKFGEGTVVATKQSGGELIADIAFKGVGIKSLVVRLAPIEIAD